MPIENLISIQAPLAEAFSQLDPETILHADEITKERQTNRELRHQWFWTADGAIYTIEKDTCQHCGAKTKEEPTLHLTRGKDNPVFKNIKEAAEQLRRDNDYILEQGNPDLEAAINSETTLKAKLSDLKLQSESGEWSYFKIDTKRYGKLNPEQRKVAERAYGQGNDFTENMKMLGKAGINTTRVYVLTPEYVERHTPKDSAIARAFRLNNFVNDSSFFADGRIVDDPISRLLGVLKKPEGRDVQKGSVVAPSFEEVVAYSTNFIPDAYRKDFETGLQKLYKQ